MRLARTTREPADGIKEHLHPVRTTHETSNIAALILSIAPMTREPAKVPERLLPFARTTRG